MPRIRLKQEENYRFFYETIINVRDVNYGGHLSNDAVVGLVHEARINLLASIGCTELNLGDKETGLIMADLGVNYLSQGKLLEHITIYSQIVDIKNSSFRIAHKISNNDNIIALIETGLVAFNYQSGTVASLPEQFLGKIK